MHKRSSYISAKKHIIYNLNTINLAMEITYSSSMGYLRGGIMSNADKIYKIKTNELKKTKTHN